MQTGMRIARFSAPINQNLLMSRAPSITGFLLAVLLTGMPALQAAEITQQPLPLFDLAAPSFTSYTIHDGLPASVMTGVVVDRAGFVLASSASSIVRYDGSHWELDTPYASNGTLPTLTLRHDGSLWAAFRDTGIARFDGTRWQPQADFPSRFARRLVETVRVDGGYDFWGLTTDQGLFKFDGKTWHKVSGSAQLPRDLLNIAVTHSLFGQSRIWVGCGSAGLWYREGDGPWQRFSAPGFEGSQIEDLLVTHDQSREQLWISAFGSGLWRLEDSGLRNWTLLGGELPSNSIYSLARSEVGDGESVIWVASRAGLLRIFKDQVQVFDRSNGLVSDVVRDLRIWNSPDGVQILWLATEGGMARAIADVRPWSTASLLGARSTGVFAVLVEPHAGGERLWAGAQQDGLGLYENRQWRHFGIADGLPTNTVRMIRRIADGDGGFSVWIGLSGGGLARVFDGPRFQTAPVPWPQVTEQSVLDLVAAEFEGIHDIWVATRANGLYRLRQGQWQAIAPPDAPAQWRSTALLHQVDAQGRRWIWATSSLGLLRFDGRKMEVVLGPDVLHKLNLLGISLFEDEGESVLWIGSGNGLVRVNITDPLHPRLLDDDLPAAPDPVVYDATRDSAGRIYLCTNNGVQLLKATAKGYSSRVFTRRDGLPHDECNTNARFIDVHDRYWTGTLGGLAVYDPSAEHEDRQPKPLRILDAWIGSRQVDADDIVMKPDERNLKIRFALLSWLHNDKSRFRTQLIGDELEPGSWSAANERSFNHLPPGSYTLRIEAMDYADNASTPMNVSIRVMPAWWQTGAARVALVLAAALLFYMILQWRNRAFTRQRRMLEEQVADRTRDLNQANTRLTELSLQDPLTGLSNRRKLHQVMQLGLESEPIRSWSLIFIDVDHFKDYNDRYGHPAGDEALRAVASAMLRCAPPHALLARYGGEEFACLIPGASRAEACDVAECMRVTMRNSQVTVPGSSVLTRLTISAGVAERVITESADFHKLLHEADKALYQAKNAGRDRVCVSDRSPILSKEGLR